MALNDANAHRGADSFLRADTDRIDGPLAECTVIRDHSTNERVQRLSSRGNNRAVIMNEKRRRRRESHNAGKCR